MTARLRPAALANNYVVVQESPDPKKYVAYSPGIARLPSRRLVATMDQGVYIDGKRREQGGGIPADRSRWWGKIYYSDNRGRSWRHAADMPMRHARPFAAGKALYVLGHSGDLVIMRSDDGGSTCREPVQLTEGQHWHQTPCNVWYARDRIYLVMELVTDPAFKGWTVSVLAPVMMSARVTDDLTRKEAWTFSSILSFREAITQSGGPRLIGVPFFAPGPTAPGSADPRTMAPIGWLETNIVQFRDPNHVWHDPSGRTFHLWMRAHTGATNLACIAKAVESEDGRHSEVSLEKAPSGEPVLYVPCPGGHLKFHILWDDPSRLFWLLSSQATDSMTRPDRLPPGRYNLPNNERHRLASAAFLAQLPGLVFRRAGSRQRRCAAGPELRLDGHRRRGLARAGALRGPQRLERARRQPDYLSYGEALSRAGLFSGYWCRVATDKRRSTPMQSELTMSAFDPRSWAADQDHPPVAD